MWDTPNRELSYAGRWLSPDPAGSGWNQYASPTNPNSQSDPTGLDGPYTCTIRCHPPQTRFGDHCDASFSICNFADGGVGVADNGGISFFTGPAPGQGSVAADGGQNGTQQNGLVNPDGTYPYTTIGSTTPYGCDGATACVESTPITDTYCVTGQCAPDTGNPYVFTSGYVTAATDVAGIAALFASEKVRRGFGIAGLFVSTWNDPSLQNITINLVEQIPGFDGPMTIAGAFIDALDYKFNSDPVNILEDKSDFVIPATVSNGEASFPNLVLVPCGGWCQ